MGKHIHIRLSPDQRQELKRLIHAGHASARRLTRAHILLQCDESLGPRMKDEAIAKALSCCRGTVRAVRHRFHEEGLQAALSEKPRPGAVPKVTGEVEAQLVLLACSDPPEGRARWTLRLLAQQLVELGVVDSISHVTVGEHLKKTICGLGK
jgi:transposase